jgi:sec-independent protein translocase protein TatA
MLAFIGSPEQIGIILVVLFLLFGAKRLPDLARSLGQGMRELRKSAREITEEPEDTHSGSPPKSS